jgi:rRNA maturation RNase YbeY
MAVRSDGFVVVNRQRGVRIALPALREFLRRVLDDLRLAETELVICFVTDAEMARMNLAYRKKRGPTDVLSFPAAKVQVKPSAGLRASAVRQGLKPIGRHALNVGAEAPTHETAFFFTAGKARPLQNQADAEYLGDIAISPVTARRNARKYGRGLALELRILMLHGVLHLLGYDHETDDGEMNRLENKLRRRFGLT